MKIMVLFSICLFVSNLAIAQNHNEFDQWYMESVNRCFETKSVEPSLTMENYSFNMSTEELRISFLRTYNVSKRLPNFAYYDDDQESFTTQLDSGEPIRLTAFFIYAIKGQIESALKRELADYISVADMGVARFYVPLEKWSAIKERYPDFYKHRTQIYERIADARDTKLFYPSAMMYRLKERKGDDRLRFRQVNRNLIANNYSESLDVVYNLDHPMNTVWEIKEHKMISAGFTISANKNGCFPYYKNGEKFYFDLTFSNLKDPRAKKEY